VLIPSKEIFKLVLQLGEISMCSLVVPELPDPLAVIGISNSSDWFARQAARRCGLGTSVIPPLPITVGSVLPLFLRRIELSC